MVDLPRLRAEARAHSAARHDVASLRLPARQDHEALTALSSTRTETTEASRRRCVEHLVQYRPRHGCVSKIASPPLAVANAIAARCHARHGSCIGTFAAVGHFSTAPDFDDGVRPRAKLHCSVSIGCVQQDRRHRLRRPAAAAALAGRSDAQLLWNAYPAFSRAFAPIEAGVDPTLAPFVHCNAVISGKTAIKTRPMPLKATANESKAKRSRAAAYGSDDVPAME